MKVFSSIQNTIFAVFFILLVSCDDSGENGTTTDGFDQEALLSNLGENYIIPAYTNLGGDINQLETSVAAFANTSDISNLQAVRGSFEVAYKSWQSCSMLEFGPADATILRGSMNIYPTNTTQIESNIESGNYNLDAASNASAKGLPAMDYLLYGTGFDEAEVVAYFTDETFGAARLQYLQNIATDMRVKVDAVLQEWVPSGGNYLDTFVSSTGTSVGSSLGLMVNALMLDYERFVRDGKIGIPAGVRSAGVTRPTAVEANYSEMSKELAVECLNAYQKLYLGNALQTDASGQGLDDYLTALGREQLSQDIDAQFTTVINDLSALEDRPLSVTISSNNQSVLDVYAEMQKLVVLLKVDMTSALGVLISYQDNDGD